MNLGGGGETYCRVRSSKPLLEASEIGVGLVGAFLLREMTESRQKGGGNVSYSGGSKNVFGEGFFAEFTVCFPPP